MSNDEDFMALVGELGCEAGKVPHVIARRVGRCVVGGRWEVGRNDSVALGLEDA